MIKSGGFTLIELVLVVAIISMITALSLPIVSRLQSGISQDIAAQDTARLLRRAQTYARGMKQDSTWSIRASSTSVILYKGATFASRDTGFDETVTYQTTTTGSGLTDITFAKLTGLPSANGQILLSGYANQTETITLNSRGSVAIQ